MFKTSILHIPKQHIYSIWGWKVTSFSLSAHCVARSLFGAQLTLADGILLATPTHPADGALKSPGLHSWIQYLKAFGRGLGPGPLGLPVSYGHAPVRHQIRNAHQTAAVNCLCSMRFPVILCNFHLRFRSAFYIYLWRAQANFIFEGYWVDFGRTHWYCTMWYDQSDLI